MKIILLKDIKGVGKKFDVKDVNDGYAMNKLIPQKLAEAASLGSLKRIEKVKADDAMMRKVNEDLARKNISELQKQKIQIKEKVNEKGHLFAGLNAKEIAEAVKNETRIEIMPEWIVLDKPIKTTGEYNIEVSWHGVKGSFTIEVVGSPR